MIGKTRRTARLVGMCALSLSVACSGTDATGLSGPEGSYTLQTVNAKPLPLVTPDPDDPAIYGELLSWVITLKGDNTFSAAMMGRTTNNGVVKAEAINYGGTYTLSGSNLRMSEPSGNYLDGVLAGSSLTITTGTSGPKTWVFKR